MSSLKNTVDTQSEMKECHIFIAITNMVRSNKLIAISEQMKAFVNKIMY